MADYPLLFRITHAVRCSNFEAIVVTDGRALMAFDDGEWWCHGVEPGGLTENGPAPSVAYEKFRSSFRHVLDDLAEESGSFEAFQRDARTFFNADAVEERHWHEALTVLRDMQDSEIDASFRGMQRLAPRPSVMWFRDLVEHGREPLGKPEQAEMVVLSKAA